ncbi:conserved membrane hypothetical protein [Burkholderiales bacterium]|nr:conserved membrane hypothetical protein [Burkholderiales bacterium]
MGTIRQTIRARPRLFLSILAGAGSGLVVPSPWDPVARALIGWNVTVWCYLALVCWLMVRSSNDRVRRLAEQEDRGAGIILAIMSAAAIVSLAAIVLELSATRNLSLGHRLANYAFTGATVFGSWFLVGMLFTFHYARTYYRSPTERRALRFPDGETGPDYWDFLYFSFTIAAAAQTSDVSVMTRPMRQIVLAQSVLSFFFNLAILGLSVNVAASLVGA